MNRKKSTRQLIGIDDIKNGSVVTADGELAFYFVHPSNLNVLPEQGVRAKVQELLGVLKGMAELELLALNSKESFQDNRQFYRQRLEAEDMPAIRELLVQDRQHLDSVQTTMASSREFCFVLRRRKTDGTMNYASLEQQFRDCGFVVQRAEGQRLLELLAIYFERLKAIQREVEGLFQPLSMGDGVVLCCNDEGKLNGMQPNRRLGDDIICGPFFLVGDDHAGGFCSLTEEQIQRYTQVFQEPEQFTGQEPELEPHMELYMW